MATDPGIGYRVVATVKSLKGECSAGHRVGERFEISCHDPAGLCGFFYHDVFPSLYTFQFGGAMPWWNGDVIEAVCPDPHNQVTIQLEGFKRS
ncbi:MAG: TIGR04076 family protein [Deltaproteobacteria bacterium]|nr:TIGR04076 family protein [Deltaproteobacteria bacterium]MBW1956797.1 TIGR04076 family protein [Deltaproteobacteria bacterium]MBW2133412.1 TIGR04076 family protein [Deltaproteobacteria bacterium]